MDASSADNSLAPVLKGTTMTSTGSPGKHYQNMTREERIAESDRAAVMELENQLRQEIKQKHAVEIKSGELSNLIEEWLKKHNMKGPGEK